MKTMLKNKFTFIYIISVLAVQISATIASFPVETFPSQLYYLITMLTFNISLITIAFSLYQVVIQTIKNAQASTKFTLLSHQQHLLQEQAKSISLHRNSFAKTQKKLYSNLEQFHFLLENQDYSQASQNLHTLTENFQEQRFHPICQNSLLNAILANKRDIAINDGISVNYNILLPSELNIALADLSSIFFNLLDNGIESCRKSGQASPYLTLTTTISAGFLSIHMVNSKNQEEHFNKKTSKKDDWSHGFGLAIIEDISKQSDGFCQWKDNGESFESQVLIRY